MTVICVISVIAGIYLTKTDVEGKLLQQTKTKYYVDFSADLKKNGWELKTGRDGKQLVDKANCIELSTRRLK